MIPKVLNKYKATKDELVGSVYCGRGSPWGNPFKIGIDGTRDAVCDRFEKEILPSLDVSKLKGKNLVCYCAPVRCHCDAILKKANQIDCD